MKKFISFPFLIRLASTPFRTILVGFLLMQIISLFSGCGGLDLGFTKEGFEVVFANDRDKHVLATYEANHATPLDIRSITTISSEEIPEAEGIVGGPPCQSWSLAGAMRGLKDQRGQLFLEYVRVLRDKQPLFFVAENVPGMVSSTHVASFERILEEFTKVGYSVTYQLMDARNYGVPQERRRVIIVGYHHSLGRSFIFPKPSHNPAPTNGGLEWLTMRDAIGDLSDPVPALDKNYPNPEAKQNHEYFIGGFSYIYMSRNRIRQWDQQSFTIQASGRHAPLHPDSTPMRRVTKDVMEFVDPNPSYRRLSVREVARIQTFPDDFHFHYKNVNHGYKMIGNAVPVKLSQAVARVIRDDLKSSHC